jgi:transposase
MTCRKAIALADRAYDADWIRDVIDIQDCRACIPPKSNRTNDIPYCKRICRRRNLIERFFDRIKQFRRIATRYDRLAETYLAMVKLASTRLWLRTYESAAQLSPKPGARAATSGSD